MTQSERFRPFAAVFVILRDGNKVLLARRSQTGHYDGWYSLPSGHIDGSESLTAAAIREAHEEIGVQIDPGEMTFAHLCHRGPTQSADMGEAREYLDIYFLVTKWHGEPVICEPDKCDDLQWVDLGDLPNNCIPYVQDVLTNVSSGTNYSEAGWKPQASAK